MCAFRIRGAITASMPQTSSFHVLSIPYAPTSIYLCVYLCCQLRSVLILTTSKLPCLRNTTVTHLVCKVNESRRTGFGKTADLQTFSQMTFKPGLMHITSASKVSCAKVKTHYGRSKLIPHRYTSERPRETHRGEVGYVF